jgi:hypothetical protein
VLALQSLFLPQDAAVPASQQAQLSALVTAAKRSGYPIRIAIIASAADLGSVTALWHQPQTYARSLGQELSLIYRGPLLVVMPNGYGVYRLARPRAAPPSALTGISTPVGNLGTATMAAIQRLAATSGHNLALPNATTPPTASGSETITCGRTRDRPDPSRLDSQPPRPATTHTAHRNHVHLKPNPRFRFEQQLRSSQLLCGEAAAVGICEETTASEREHSRHPGRRVRLLRHRRAALTRAARGANVGTVAKSSGSPRRSRTTAARRGRSRRRSNAQLCQTRPKTPAPSGESDSLAVIVDELAGFPKSSISEEIALALGAAALPANAQLGLSSGSRVGAHRLLPL